MVKVILISGKQGSGKSTLSSGLALELGRLGNQPQAMKFAAALYEMHDAVRGCLERAGADSLKGIDGPLLQLLGTEWGRKTRGEDIWVDVLKGKLVRSPLRDSGIFIVDDCRFPNELAAFDGPEHSVLKVRLNAHESARQKRAEKWRTATDHPSETGLDGMDERFDVVLDAAASTAEQVLKIVTSAACERFK